MSRKKEFIIYDFLIIVCIVLLLITGVKLFKIFYLANDEINRIEELGISSAEDKGIDYAEELSNVVIGVDGSASDSLVEYASKYFLAIPYNIRNHYINNGWNVLLTNKDIKDTYYNGQVEGRVSGLIKFDTKITYIYASRYDVRNSLIHEFGHYLDWCCSWVSRSEEFLDIYNLEKGNLVDLWSDDGHDISIEYEYFAESFSRYVLYGDKFIEECPMTYEFIKNCVDSFE